MRIAVLMSAGSPWSRDIARELAENGHNVRVIDFQNPHGEVYLGPNEVCQARAIAAFRGELETHIFSGGPSAAFGSIPLSIALRRMLDRIRPDILLTLYGGRFAAAAYLSGFRPYAVYVAGSDVLIGGSAKRWATRHCLAAASMVIANGNYLAAKTRELAPGTEVTSLYIGTDTAKFTPGTPPTSPVRIVCTRGFLEIYNNQLLIRALSLMGELPDDFEVIFAAPGPLLARERELARRILSPHRRERIRFLGGVSREELAKVLQSSHIFVSCSRSDSASISLMEALSCGLFPVLSDIPPYREWIDSSFGNGLLTRVDDAPALAAALELASRDWELRTRAAAFNRHLILERADLHTNMLSLGRMLEKHTAPMPPRWRDLSAMVKT